MAQGRRGTGWTVVVVLLVAATAVGGFLATRAIRGTAAPRTSVTATASVSTPAAVLAATAAQPTPPMAHPAALSPAAVAAVLAPALAAPALGRSVHALVTDGQTGSVLLDRAASVASAPASTAKLATACAVLAAVAPTARLTTRVVAGARPGQVVLVGGGDPTLSAAAARGRTIYPGAARVSDLAAQIKDAGRAPVTSIIVDPSIFTGPLEAPGWAPEDVPSDYASSITGLVVDGGRPAAGGDVRSATPEVEAGRALAGRLGVGAVPVTRGVAPAGAAVLASVHSATALDLVEQMLSQSDNVLADMLARWVARVVGQPASFAGAVTAVRQALAGQGIGLPSTMVDGSGLSPTDRLSPAVLVALLRAALLGAHPRLRQLISALPVAGWDGTLAGRYRVAGSAAGAGEIRAKTGTLTGVVTLAGIVRNRQGRWLVFALMTDRVPTGALTPAEAALDRAVARLAACRCR